MRGCASQEKVGNVKRFFTKKYPFVGFRGNSGQDKELALRKPMSSATAASPSYAPSERPRWFEGRTIDFLGSLLVFAIYACNLVPDVNEPHYWTKAAHFWNPEFGKGDLFLESGDVHWAFFSTLGALTMVLPLVQAVWIGRLITWILLAVGWTHMMHRIFEPSRNRFPTFVPMAATLLAPLWLAGMHWGLWAGEWVVGGCESKCIAYAFFFFGLGCFWRRQSTWAWLSIGVGSAFHVVTGLWVIATLGLASLWTEVRWDRKSLRSWLQEHWLGWLLCLAGFTAGAWPAIKMDAEIERDSATQSAEQQVYNRLGHHLSPSKFSDSRWQSFQLLLTVTACVLLCSRRGAWRSRSASDACQNTDTPRDAEPTPTTWEWWRTGPAGVRLLCVIAAWAFGFAMFALVFDFIFSSRVPRFAASILRFYWFRWNDVMLPLVASLVGVAIASGVLAVPRPRFKRSLVGILGLALSFGLLWNRHSTNTQEKIPVGEKLNFVLKTDSDETQYRQYLDWKAVCDWIEKNTDRSSLWLTPRRQQSFKWRTGRPELASWKDMPQNASAVVEWSRRIKEAYQYDDQKNLKPITLEKLEELRRKYGIHYVLLDLRVREQSIPAWKLLYPVSPEYNQSFAVMEVPSRSDRPSAP